MKSDTKVFVMKNTVPGHDHEWSFLYLFCGLYSNTRTQHRGDCVCVVSQLICNSFLLCLCFASLQGVNCWPLTLLWLVED